LKDLDKLLNTFPFLTRQLKVPQPMIPSTREFVNISFELDEGGQMVEG
jgi:hypothetical protein